MSCSVQGATADMHKSDQSIRHTCRTGRFLFLTLILFVCSGSAQGPENRMIIARGDDNYPPYEFIDENGQSAGWNVDILKAVADMEGLNVRVRLGPRDDVRSEREAGKIDLLAGMYYSPERARAVNFPLPQIVISDTVFTGKTAGGRDGSLLPLREIISIPDMTIRKTGTQGKGARFEMPVPNGVYRYSREGEQGGCR